MIVKIFSYCFSSPGNKGITVHLEAKTRKEADGKFKALGLDNPKVINVTESTRDIPENNCK